MDTISPQTIIERLQEQLQLEWVYRPSQTSNTVLATEHINIGLYDGLHRYPITLISAEQLTKLASLPTARYRQHLHELFTPPCCLLIVCGTLLAPPDKLLSYAKRHRMPLLSSETVAHQLLDSVRTVLSDQLTPTVTRHGVMLEVLGVGVMLVGNSGVGKSELALCLINQGHRLVADDAVILTRVSANSLVATCPAPLQDFLEVRGLGVINVRAMFGDHAIKEHKRLQLIAKVVAMDHEELLQVDRLQGIYNTQVIADVDIPEVTIPVAPGRNLAVLVEGAVRNQILRLTGYEASEAFIERQQTFIEKNNERDT